jgi:hypothetical protein
MGQKRWNGTHPHNTELYKAVMSLCLYVETKKLYLCTSNSIRAGFKGQRPGWSPRGLHKTEIESTDFTEISASLKSRSPFVLLVIIIKNKKNKKLSEPKSVVTDRRSHNSKFCPEQNVQSTDHHENRLICKLYGHTHTSTPPYNQATHNFKLKIKWKTAFMEYKNYIRLQLQLSNIGVNLYGRQLLKTSRNTDERKRKSSAYHPKPSSSTKTTARYKVCLLGSRVIIFFGALMHVCVFLHCAAL